MTRRFFANRSSQKPPHPSSIFFCIYSIGVWAAVGLPWEVASVPVGLPREMGC